MQSINGVFVNVSQFLTQQQRQVKMHTKGNRYGTAFNGTFFNFAVSITFSSKNKKQTSNKQYQKAL
jgi:hypothetical protein